MTLSSEHIENIARVLTSLDCAISIHELGSRCRSKGLRINTPQLTSALRTMQQQGRAKFERGRWLSAGEEKRPIRITSPTATYRTSIAIPELSKEAKHLLQPTPTVETSGIESFWHAESEIISYITDGPWAGFRRLLHYYRRCLQAEEGADASAYQNQIRQRFLYLESQNSALPKPNFPWRRTIPISPHIAPLLGALPPPNSDDALVVGYPVSATHIAKDGEPSVSIIRPIFYFPVEHTITGGALHLYIDNPTPEINLNWLDYAFKGKPERQRAFLSACGIFNSASPETMESGLFVSGTPNIEALAYLLESFLPYAVQEPLNAHFIPNAMLREPFKNGIYNRCVLMLAKRTKYTATLCKELKYIEDAPDSVLDQTALAHLFKQRDNTDNNDPLLIHEAIMPEVLSLNAEQRLAAASLLEKKVTVITGPPGTGKSQVVAATIGGSRLKKQTLLFASRNHKALDAVVTRLCDRAGRPLIVRTNSKDDPNLKYTFRLAIRDLLATAYDSDAVGKLARLRGEIEDLLQKRGHYARFARELSQIAEEMGRLENMSSNLRHQLFRKAGAAVDTDFGHLPISSCRRILSLAQDFSRRGGKPSFLHWLRCLWSVFDFNRLRTYSRQTSFFPVLPGGCGTKFFEVITQQTPVLIKMLQLAEIRTKILPLEAQLCKIPPLDGLTAAIHDITEMLQRITPEAIACDVDSRQGLSPESNREEIDSLRHALQALETGLGSGDVEKNTIALLQEHLPTVLAGFPCWAVTSLSAGSRIPFFPGIFDLVIVDEASQSDIPSAIPLLFRAKRIGVVGDPWQLSHITRLSAARNTLLLKDAGASVKDMRFSYTGNSLYDLVAGANDTVPILLAETYRSATDIAEYSNGLFYGGRLRVATNMGTLCVPPGVKPGVHWTDVCGTVASAGQSGCYCQEEIDEIVRLLRVLLLDNSFKGSIGVVTPFRQQATRLRDALFTADTTFYQALVAANCHVDTAHGFQGDERDVMLFSLCSGNDMPAGSLSFLRETGRVFNVAVSRAKAVLHVVGNREWAAHCGISHVKTLAAPKEQKTTRETAKSEWYPHESPWEKILFDALQKRGLEPRPQFQAGSRRLDMALVDAERKVFLDIEVDGDCHRSPDGSRKTDDVWRDIQLQGMGWRVLRFWTYQLRENLAKCVDSIENAWRNDEPRT
jgi:Superfamily I DNA and RNA helicases and helicase subunits